MEDAGETPYESRRMMAADEMLIRGRLAKLYLATGQTNLSEQQIAAALECAQACGPQWQGAITNQAALMRVIAEVDKGAK
jgi:hypothetical protein